jgi:hypothetical protein
MIELGQEVKDKVTGFTGIAISKVIYLNGCVQFCVKPRKTKKDGDMPDGHYIDVEQLEVVGDGLYIAPKDTGGDMEDTPSADYRG